MQELVGRLTALDPEASETLKVVSYFDALVSGGVGVDGLLRGAAALAGTVAGVDIRGRARRRDPLGGVPVDDENAPHAPMRVIPGGAVWLERNGPAHANDEMVVERLALAIELTEARRQQEGALEIALDPGRPASERIAALPRLHVDPHAPVRVVALPAGRSVEGQSALIATRYGIVRAVLDGSTDAWNGPAGLGTTVRADRLPESWEHALIALRLTGSAHPVVDAADLGVLLLLARTNDPEHPPADVASLSRLDPRAREVLSALVAADSIRAAAAVLGIHHSTAQARYESLTKELGYDPRSALGRARFTGAELLLRLSE